MGGMGGTGDPRETPAVDGEGDGEKRNAERIGTKQCYNLVVFCTNLYLKWRFKFETLQERKRETSKGRESIRVLFCLTLTG